MATETEMREDGMAKGEDEGGGREFLSLERAWLIVDALSSHQTRLNEMRKALPWVRYHPETELVHLTLTKSIEDCERLRNELVEILQNEIGEGGGV